MCAANSWILSAPLHQGVGEDGEVRRCENEKHILCKACCNLTEDGEVGNQHHHQHSHHEHQQAMREVLFAENIHCILRFVPCAAQELWVSTMCWSRFPILPVFVNNFLLLKTPFLINIPLLRCWPWCPCPSIMTWPLRSKNQTVSCSHQIRLEIHSRVSVGFWGQEEKVYKWPFAISRKQSRRARWSWRKERKEAERWKSCRGGREKRRRRYLFLLLQLFYQVHQLALLPRASQSLLLRI